MSSLTKKSVNLKSASGITVAPSLQSAFNGAKMSRSTRFLKVEIKGDSQLVETQSVSRSGGWASDFNRVKDLCGSDDSKPFFFIAFKDAGGVLLGSYIPGNASMKDRMVYSTSKGGLLGLCGVDAEKYDATTKSELSYDAYSKHSSTAAPLTEREIALKEYNSHVAPMRVEAPKRNDQFAAIAKLAAVSKPAGKAGAPAVQVAPLPPSSPVSQAILSGSSHSASGPSVAAAAKKWGGGDKPAAGKCAVFGCTQPRLGRGYCAAHASFANSAPSPAPGVKMQNSTPAAAAGAAAAADSKADAKVDKPVAAAAATDAKADAKPADAPAAAPAPAAAEGAVSAGAAAPAFGAFGATVVIGGGK